MGLIAVSMRIIRFASYLLIPPPLSRIFLPLISHVDLSRAIIFYVLTKDQ